MRPGAIPNSSLPNGAAKFRRVSTCFALCFLVGTAAAYLCSVPLPNNFTMASQGETLHLNSVLSIFLLSRRVLVEIGELDFGPVQARYRDLVETCA